ncbi:NF038129 family PEP-CTERM protein [Paucibacter sp. AS339]|uniref:NF038129 family PEP-CTERM protein n=1 Tax=Paucibacter hankyongi TaxID=3133434 RepID=UPI0030B1E0AD
MLKKNFSLLALRPAVLALALLGLSPWASALTTRYHAEINTAGLGANGASGWLDVQFNPGNSPTLAATVRLDHFQGQFGGGYVAEGFVSGSLSEGFVLSNAGSYNDLFHSLTLGGKLSFDISFDGPLLQGEGTVGSSFAVGLMAADQQTYLGNPNGDLFRIELMPKLLSAPATIEPTMLAGDVVSLTSAVPEPASYLLLVTGLGLMGALVGRRSAAQRA